MPRVYRDNTYTAKVLREIPLLAPSTTLSAGCVFLDRMRTLVITTRTSYPDETATGLKIHLLYSPDGDPANIDTVDYASYVVNLTANSTVQETAIFDAPEQGYMFITAENQDDTQTLLNTLIWVSSRRWSKEVSLE